MITISIQELLVFAKKQDPENGVNMNQSISPPLSKARGCLMLQYGRWKFSDRKNFKYPDPTNPKKEIFGLKFYCGKNIGMKILQLNQCIVMFHSQNLKKVFGK
jgi:hypothetical protein